MYASASSARSRQYSTVSGSVIVGFFLCEHPAPNTDPAADAFDDQIRVIGPPDKSTLEVVEDLGGVGSGDTGLCIHEV